ncbi:9769_t:CDS:2 [Ambispora leptoticha]|uniref:9769_t:CDS:1 n=1 Tax=Ambispora leptoticha TaxID=144679 RepID=A0A9N9AYT4_9GLOM|nr:9769_t:CDS:2 [Ambispora leptoticha]
MTNFPIDHFRRRSRSRDRWTIAVNATDRWIGNSIACGLLRWEDENRLLQRRRGRRDGREEDWEVRALTSNPESHHVRELKREGARVCETNYKDRSSLRDALRGVDWLVHVVESRRERVRDAEELAVAAREQGVRGVIVLSLRGADEKLTRTHREYHEIEKLWQKEVRNAVVLRVEFITQGFFLWSDNIQEESALNMTLDEERDRFVPIDLDDIVRAIEDIAWDREGYELDELESKHRHQVYNLTGRDSVSPGDIIDIINDNIRGEIYYERVNRNELRDYIRSLDGEGDDRYRRREFVDIEKRRRGEKRGREYDLRSFLPFNEIETEKVLDILLYIKEGREPDRVSDDFRRITGEEPRSIDEFFRENADEFTPGGRGAHRRRGRRGESRERRRESRERRRESRERRGRRGRRYDLVNKAHNRFQQSRFFAHL